MEEGEGMPRYCTVPKQPWTVKIGWQEHGATKWHPTEKDGPFSTLVRGMFATREEAGNWASRELGPGNWEVVRFCDLETGEA